MTATLLDVILGVLREALGRDDDDDGDLVLLSEALVEAIAPWLVSPRNGETEIDNT